MRIDGSGMNVNRYQNADTRNDFSQNINQDDNLQIDSQQGRGRKVGRQEHVQGSQRTMATPSEDSYFQDSELSNVLGQDEYIPNQQVEGQQGHRRKPNAIREGMGQDRQPNGVDGQMGRRPMERGHGRGHGGMNMPPMGGMPPGMQAPGQMPNAEEFFAQVDQDGDGSITKEELTAFTEAQQTAMNQSISSDSSETDSAIASDPAEIKNNVLANLVAMADSDDYANMSDLEKQQLAATIEAVNALDTGDADFITKLQALFGVTGTDTTSTVSETSETEEATETTETLDPAQIKEQVLANLVAMSQS